jgi:hypothetical protein
LAIETFGGRLDHHEVGDCACELTSVHAVTDGKTATPEPASSTTPAKSYPKPDGNVIGNIAAASGEEAMPQSIGFRPAAVTRTRTSPEPELREHDGDRDR